MAREARAAKCERGINGSDIRVHANPFLRRYRLAAPGARAPNGFKLIVSVRRFFRWCAAAHLNTRGGNVLTYAKIAQRGLLNTRLPFAVEFGKSSPSLQ